MPRKPMLICGGGIAGLTLAIRLREQGEEAVVIERESEPSSGGYMMDFYGTGWDVASRMGLTEQLRGIHYPIDRMEYVGGDGEPYINVSIERIRRAFDDRYSYLRRSDLANVLLERAKSSGATLKFGTTVTEISQEGEVAHVTLSDGQKVDCEAVFGADGLHSGIRNLVFGAESQFASYLGFFVAAFELPSSNFKMGRAFKMHEATDTVVGYYPISSQAVAAMYAFRSSDLGHVPKDRRVPLLKERFIKNGWISEKALEELSVDSEIYFDSTTQIRMDTWHKNRTVLLGDACGCLTLLAGQGSHMAMAGAYVLANEMRKSPRDLRVAFERYEAILRPHIVKKQASAASLAKSFVPSKGSNRWIRKLFMKTMFKGPFLKIAMGAVGSKSVLEHYA